MNLADVLGISGFLIAAFTFIQSLIRKAKIEVVVGPSFEVYYKPDGATGFYIPIAFINEGEKPGKIISLSLKLIPPKPSKSFQIRWRQFVKHDNKNNTFDHLDYTHAFSVPEQSVIDKFIYFLWDSQNIQKLLFIEGVYHIELLLNQTTSPGINKIFNFGFSINKEDIIFFETEAAQKQGRTRKITISNYSEENILV